MNANNNEKISIIMPVFNENTKKQLLKILPSLFLVLAIIYFLWFKFAHLTFRFSDGNVYFYLAKIFLEGKVPYRDFFLAAPPFLILFLSPFKFIFANNILLFYAIPIVLEAATAILIYFILRHFKNSFAFIAPFAYLFSFSIIATSDHFTGVQLASFLTALAIFIYLKKHLFLSGFIFALACLTKFYAAPAFLGFLIFISLEHQEIDENLSPPFFQRWLYFLLSPLGCLKRKFQQGVSVIRNNHKAILRFSAGATTAGIIILSPFLIISCKNTFNYLVLHHLNRPAGLDKFYVLRYFFTREWPFLILGFLGFFIIKKRILTYPFILTFLFLLFFQDLYYLYLAYLIFFLIIFSFSFLSHLKAKNKFLASTLLISLIAFIFFSFDQYQKSHFNENRFLNVEEIVQYVKLMPEQFELYGKHEITPLIALLSEKKVFNDCAETNTQGFASGVLDIDKISNDAASQGIYLISHINDYPRYGIMDFGYEGFFKKEVFEKYCRREKSFSSQVDGKDSQIVIYRCKK